MIVDDDSIHFRYEKYWLPFMSAVSGSVETDVGPLCPPLDIHWVWHTHMLAPVSYSADCTAVAGRLVGHTLTSSQIREANRSVQYSTVQYSTVQYRSVGSWFGRCFANALELLSWWSH